MKLSAFNLLREGKKFNIENHHLSNLLNESLLDVRHKNAANLSDEEFANLVRFDPVLSTIPTLTDEVMAATPENYSRWLLKLLKNGELSKTSPEKMQKLLKAFSIAKNRRNLLPSNDINSYKTVEELETAVKAVKDNLTTNQKNKDAKRNQKELQGEKKTGMYMDGAVELLFNGNKWEVWTPHTFEGSKALRRGASWCTGGDNCSFYDAYTGDGQLYVIINKQNPSSKYQLFVPFEEDTRNREFRDENNDAHSFREFVHDNDELLDFFLTQDLVTNAFENLDNPNVDDEWDENKEDEVANEYNLGYINETWEVCMDIDYDELLTYNHYVDVRDIKDFASTDELSEYSNMSELMKDIIQTNYFSTDINWQDTDLNDVYRFFLYDTKISSEEINFIDFIKILFNAENKESNEKVENWLESRCENYVDKVADLISTTPAYDMIYNFIRTNLERLGWNPPSPNLSNYRNTAYNNDATRYLEQFTNVFKYKFDDCHSFEDFYNDIADHGHKSYEDIKHDYDIEINEREGEIDPSDADLSFYDEEFARDDARQILDLFVSNEEYNNLLYGED